MEHRLLWAVAVILGAAALVAGCLNVNVPEGPYVVAGNTSVGGASSAAERQRLDTMDRKGLENEVLRLTGENDALRMQNDNLKRENKLVTGERDRYKDDADNLRAQLNRMK